MFTSIITTLQNFIIEMPQLQDKQKRELYSYEITNELGRLLSGFRNFVKDNDFEEAEIEFYTLFKDKINYEIKFYQGRYNSMFKGADIAERLKKVVWSLSEHGKRLGIYAQMQPKPTQKKAPALSDVAQNSNKKLSEKEKKILESISIIESMVNDLKNLVKNEKV